MDRSSLIGTLLSVVLFFLLTSCSDTGSSSTQFMPSLDVEMASTLTSSDSRLALSEIAPPLVVSSDLTVIEDWAIRADRVIDKVNSVFSRLNTERVSGTGFITAKGPDKGITGQIRELSGDADYNYEAVLCHFGNKFLHTKWSSDGNKIQVFRDFSFNPMSFLTSVDLTAESIYVKDETNVTLITKVQGVPWFRPGVISSGLTLVEYHKFVKTLSTGAMTMTGVNDWYSEEPTDGVFGGDGYVVGSVESDGTGEFVAYRNHNTALCPDSFDEDDETSPGWCLGRSIGSSTRFTDSERDEAWTRLQSIGIAKKSNLTSVSISTEMECSN